MSNVKGWEDGTKMDMLGACQSVFFVTGGIYSSWKRTRSTLGAITETAAWATKLPQNKLERGTSVSLCFAIAATENLCFFSSRVIFNRIQHVKTEYVVSQSWRYFPEYTSLNVLVKNAPGQRSISSWISVTGIHAIYLGCTYCKPSLLPISVVKQLGPDESVRWIKISDF